MRLITNKLSSHKHSSPQTIRSHAVDNEDGTAEIYIYDSIYKSFWGESIDAEAVQGWLAELANTEKITVRLNSPGGSVFEGQTIYSLLASARQEIVCQIDGLCASIATVIASAGSRVLMAEHGLYMIHDPMGMAWGDSAAMRKTAELLDKVKKNIVGIYHAKTKQTDVQLAGWMSEETWFDAAEALEHGFIDEVIPNKSGGEEDGKASNIAAQVDPQVFARFGFRNVPKQLSAQLRSPESQPIMSNTQLTNPTPPANPAQPSNNVQPAQPVASIEMVAEPLRVAPTVQQIKLACPGADSEFILAQMEAGNSLDDCRTNWMTAQNQRLAELQNGTTPNKPGVDPLGGKATGKTCEGDPIAAWNAAVEAKLAEGLNNAAAIKAVVQEDPDLHTAYLDAYNERNKASRKRAK